ncbi:MAG: cytochrome c [Pseudomonadota bacterium]
MTGFAALVVVGAGLGVWFSRPGALPDAFAAEMAAHAASAEAGAMVFHAADCASCHVAPDGAADVLAGGKAFASDFGTFYAPNISSHPVAGIGGWDLDSFARAVTLGVSPSGQHYYPAFPYAAYQHMTAADVADLFAYMQGLPASDVASLDHAVGFPFNIRRGLGLWKAAFVPGGYVADMGDDPVLKRGQYLVEGLAHCAECHTPRNAAGGLDTAQWMAGAPNPSGPGRIPGITPAALDWSAGDLVEYFTSGFTPDYDSAGGQMAAVVENLARLPRSDRAAIAAYLLALP